MVAKAWMADAIHNVTWPFVTPRATRELVADIEAIQDQLADGQRRVIPTPVSLELAWFPGPDLDLDHGTQVMSDHGVPTAYPDVEASYHEEVELFDAAIESTPDDQQRIGRASGQAANRLMLGMAKRAHAIGNWSRYAIPLRVVGGQVFHIRAPRDLAGTPIIKAVPIQDFVCRAAIRTARDSFEKLQMKAQLNLWRIIAAFLLVIVLIQWL